ncbi:MAG: transposase [Acinetobacter sp.]
MKRLPRRQFTAEYKTEAVKLVLEQGLNQSHAARQLNISVKSLANWIQQHNGGKLKGSLGVERLSPDQLRIRELERELAIAKMERDILKKATAYFARESK